MSETTNQHGNENKQHYQLSGTLGQNQGVCHEGGTCGSAASAVALLCHAE